MKKLSTIIMIMILICIFDSCKSLGSLNYPEPEFTKPQFDKPLVFVIDTFKVKGKFKDYVKLHNNSTDSNIRFNIYVHHPGTQAWMVYGTGILKGSGDTDTIDSGMSDVDSYRYFAIESLNDKKYSYQFYKSHSDLHITIFDN